MHAHLRYISRGGELELEGRDGERLHGRDAIKEAAVDWAADDLQTGKVGQIAKSYVVSYPDDRDREAVYRAGRALARSLFAANHEYLLVPHRDTAHPHIHIAVRALGDDGSRLRPDDATYERWRASWPEHLHSEGLPAVTSPRWTRGLVQRGGCSMAMWRLEAEYLDGGAPPRVLVSAADRALEEARGRSYTDQPWIPAIHARHDALRRTYRDAAFELSRSPDPADRQLGRRVAALEHQFGEPITRRTELVRAAEDRVRVEQLEAWLKRDRQERTLDRDLDLSR
ncbi:relaxase/mobilization nuclease domain-containing protein [Caulobacter segnis]|uniref:relaxase/mobilization nuclease domain-containing protein n=1 Tax=Caulobacter segnis TaxID=88688 RepID=UPI0024102CF8|nr:relaxase/mobilization nuclease domain-containing protein [Caulobacter segnis]MDG2522171.1 relaxase/mobilization nuclease domain-containing protein [Caulobacter segnis]